MVNFNGTSGEGGIHNSGVIYEHDPAGNALAVKYSFARSNSIVINTAKLAAAVYAHRYMDGKTRHTLQFF